MFIIDVALSRCNKAVPQKFVNDVISAVYTDEYTAERSLGGMSSKESTKTGRPAPPDRRLTLNGADDVQHCRQTLYDLYDRRSEWAGIVLPVRPASVQRNTNNYCETAMRVL